MNCKTFLALAVAAVACSTSSVRADLAASGDKLLQQELRQEQIKATTSRVGVQLGAVIDEYERNGLEGDDVVVLKAIRGVLDKLSAAPWTSRRKLITPNTRLYCVLMRATKRVYVSITRHAPSS